MRVIHLTLNANSFKSLERRQAAADAATCARDRDGDGRVTSRV